MTVTDELRKLLDEHGVEHEDKHTELAQDIIGWDSTWWQGIAGMTFLAISDEAYGREGCVYINGAYLTPEQAITATLGGQPAKLTAKQVREAIFHGSVYASYDGAQYYGIRMQAIADELNATLGSGTCKLEETESYPSENGWVHVLECSNCGQECEHVNGDYEYCPHCLAKNELF